ncbi:MAG: alpha,alpha-trehalose-phosphate synthase (UDP-forming) [Planctomycetota bacterium]|jgi:trehalose 6-phosphate synthase
MEKREMHLVAVSNRLPVKLVREKEKWVSLPGEGGLVTALAPVLKNRGGLWIGWPGVADAEGIHKPITDASREVGYDLHPVKLTGQEVNGYYRGFSNEIIWPLFHGLETRCNFVPEYWHAYLEVNRKFAEAVAYHSAASDYVWINDYHLMNVAKQLREIGAERRTGFFLHIPFPPVDFFMKLPWRAEILRGLFEYDLIGFQTMNDRRNFINCLRILKYPGLKIKGRGSVVTGHLGDREVRIGCFPISIDFKQFSEQAASDETKERSWYFHEAFPEMQIILGVDRLDYTKGITERLEAFSLALEKYKEMRGKVTLVQVVVPSRQDLPEYENLKSKIEQLVTKINGQFTIPGWIPIHYLYRSLPRPELIAYYRAAEVAIVTPLRDGMNLVAKEYCACNEDNRGVLILSEFAGAAAELQKGALLVNPYDIEGMAGAIHDALNMPEEDKRARMKRMRSAIRKQDIFRWVNSILEAAFAKNLDDFPAVEEFMPGIKPESRRLKPVEPEENPSDSGS